MTLALIYLTRFYLKLTLVVTIFAFPLQSQATISCTKIFRTNLVSETLSSYGFTNLSHRTNLKNLKQILLTKKLIPPKERFSNITKTDVHSAVDSVFFDIGKGTDISIDHPYGLGLGVNGSSQYRTENKEGKDSKVVGQIHNGGLRKVILEFSTSTLEDSRDFHISSFGHNYGARRPGDYVNQPGNTSNNTQLVSYLNEHHKYPGEVVVKGTVGLESLTSIWIVEVYRDSVLHELKEAGIHSINGIPIEQVLKPIKILVPYEELANGDLILFWPEIP